MPHLKLSIKEKVVTLFKIISDPTRIDIIYALKDEPLTVTEIVSKVGLSQSAISHQLKTLRDADLVRSTRSGKHMLYQISDNHVYNIFNQAIDHVQEEKCHES